MAEYNHAKAAAGTGEDFVKVEPRSRHKVSDVAGDAEKLKARIEALLGHKIARFEELKKVGKEKIIFSWPTVAVIIKGFKNGVVMDDDDIDAQGGAPDSTDWVSVNGSFGQTEPDSVVLVATSPDNPVQTFPWMTVYKCIAQPHPVAEEEVDTRLADLDLPGYLIR